MGIEKLNNPVQKLELSSAHQYIFIQAKTEPTTLRILCLKNEAPKGTDP
jgi:hypothetical protein